jgi:hypothetical protein
MVGAKPLSPFVHIRRPWVGGETVYVCAKLTVLNGNEPGLPASRRPLYLAAKLGGSQDSAAKIVTACISDTVIDRIIDDTASFMMKGTPLVCVVPHPPFDDLDGVGADLAGRPRVRNALPIQYAAQLKEILDAEIDTEIVEIGRVSRTKLRRFPSRFDGAVRQDAAYILVDDVFTSGGTLAALRSHILGAGGTVAAVTTLAHGSGQWQPLALSDGTWHELCSIYGRDLDPFWRREIGHDARNLTEAEGRTLARWGTYQSSRPPRGAPYSAPPKSPR